jgi:hypothetical protein
MSLTAFYILFIAGLPLHYFELPFNFILHEILEFDLDLLGLPEDIPELEG